MFSELERHANALKPYDGHEINMAITPNNLAEIYVQNGSNTLVFDLPDNKVDVSEGPQGWYRLLDSIPVLRKGLFTSEQPLETAAIGTGEQQVLFHNFEAPMSARQVADCYAFVTRAMQFFGAQTTDIVTDVVLSELIPHDDQPAYRGFTIPGADKVMFINSSLWDGDGQNIASGDACAERQEKNHYYDVSPQTIVMLHEFNHLLHGFSEPNIKKLLKFAASIGWDVPAMERDEIQNVINDNVRKYAPRRRIEYLTSSRERLEADTQEFKKLLFSDEQSGMRPLIWWFTGLTSRYAAKNPAESYAVTGAELMAGEDAAYRYPILRDAWLEHARTNLEARRSRRDAHALSCAIVPPLLTVEFI